MGFVNLLKGKSEKLKSILDDIAEDTMKYHAVLESCKFKHPITVLECDYHIALSNDQEQIYKDKYEVFLFANMEYFSKFESSSKTSLVAPSRDPSPCHRGPEYRQIKHMIPKELLHNCDPRQYKKFQRD